MNWNVTCKAYGISSYGLSLWDRLEQKQSHTGSKPGTVLAAWQPKRNRDEYADFVKVMHGRGEGAIK